MPRPHNIVGAGIELTDWRGYPGGHLPAPLKLKDFGHVECGEVSPRLTHVDFLSIRFVFWPCERPYIPSTFWRTRHLK